MLLRLRSLRVITSMAVMLFMSRAPLPQMKPLLIAPLNGAIVHSFSSAGTTSKWERRSRRGFCPFPLSLVMMLPLWGEDSRISVWKPSLFRVSARNSAALVSFPGGLVVSICIS